MKTVLFMDNFEIEDQKILIIVSFAVVGRKGLSEDASKRKKWKKLTFIR